MLAQGLSLPTIALIESVALAAGLLFDLPTGYMSDKLGRKLTLVSANVAHSLGFLVLALSHEPWQFLVAAVIQAAGFALMSGTDEAYVYESKPDDYKRAFSNANITDEGATILGLLCAPVLTSLFSLQAVFFVAACVIFFGGSVSLFLLRETVKAVQSDLGKKEKVRLRFVSLIYRHTPLLFLFIILAAYHEGGRVFWQPQLVESGFSVAQLGYLFAAFKLASLIGAYAGRYQKLSLKQEIVGVGLLLTVSFMLIASTVNFLVIAGFFMYFFLENVYRIASSNYLQGLVGDSLRATFLSVAGFTRQGYSIIVIPLLGIVSGVDLVYVFYALVIMQLIATILFWIFANRLKLQF